MIRKNPLNTPYFLYKYLALNIRDYRIYDTEQEASKEAEMHIEVLNKTDPDFIESEFVVAKVISFYCYHPSNWFGGHI